MTVITELIGKYNNMLTRQACNKIFSERFPYEVRIETINTCNNICSFCPVNINSEKSKIRKVVRMDWNLYKKIIDELATLNFFGILKLYNNNEPLIDKRLVEFVRYAKEKLPHVRKIQIMTSALLLTKKLGDELIKNGITYLHVNDYTKKGGGGINYKKESIKGIFDSLISEHKNVKMIYLPRIIVEVMDSRAGHAPNNDDTPSSPLKNSCIYPFYQFPITSNGNVGLCCVDSIYEEPLGNLKEATIQEIWNGNAYVEFRKNLSDGKRGKMLCSKCTFAGHADISDLYSINESFLLYRLLRLPYKAYVKYLALESSLRTDDND